MGWTRFWYKDRGFFSKKRWARCCLHTDGFVRTGPACESRQEALMTPQVLLLPALSSSPHIPHGAFHLHHYIIATKSPICATISKARTEGLLFISHAVFITTHVQFLYLSISIPYFIYKLQPAKLLLLLQSYDNDKTSLKPDSWPKKVVIWLRKNPV